MLEWAQTQGQNKVLRGGPRRLLQTEICLEVVRSSAPMQLHHENKYSWFWRTTMHTLEQHIGSWCPWQQAICLRKLKSNDIWFVYLYAYIQILFIISVGLLFIFWEELQFDYANFWNNNLKMDSCSEWHVPIPSLPRNICQAKSQFFIYEL